MYISFNPFILLFLVGVRTVKRERCRLRSAGRVNLRLELT